MARRLLVSIDGLAREATGYKIAVDGVVKPIKRACVADQGVVRQYYPYATGDDEPDQRIVLSPNTINIREQAVSPATSSASIVFTRSNGTYTYNNYPNADVIEPYLLPALDGTPADDGLYLIKVSQVSGDALTGTLDTWIDLNSAETFTWSLDQAVTGTLSAVATISIAPNDGGGLPVVEEQIDKTANFTSTVTLAALGWSDDEWNISEIKQGLDADCLLSFSPTGLAVGQGDTSGDYSQSWSGGIGYPPNPQDYTVLVTVVSGTAPTGSDIGVTLTLDQVRSWTLATDGEQILDCELDVEVHDGVAGVTKRVTMHSEREDVNTDNIWQLLPAFVIGEDVLDPDAAVNIRMHPRGDVIGEAPGWPLEIEPWHSEAPSASDPSNYEVLLSFISGIRPTGGDPMDVWMNCGTQREWTWSVDSGVRRRSASMWMRFRKIGEAYTEKLVIIAVDGQ